MREMTNQELVMLLTRALHTTAEKMLKDRIMATCPDETLKLYKALTRPIIYASESRGEELEKWLLAPRVGSQEGADNA